ncbi:MAG: N-formylglutamate amidohydrolase [Planctomycetota bacterium]
MFDSRQVVVSVEHATNHVPSELGTLGLDGSWLLGHHAWDPGAARIGEEIARAFDVPLHLGHVSRLVTDLNRSSNHPRLCARDLRPEGVPVPANAALDRRARAERRDAWWRPWREGVEADLDRVVAEFGTVLHLSIHSFTGSFGSVRRTNALSWMYDPKHGAERALADRMDLRCREVGLTIRRNWPYSGLDDGFCMRMRAERSNESYLGFEIETNQDLVGDSAGADRIASELIAALRSEFGG